MAERWTGWARTLRADVLTLYLAARDPRVPWHVKALAMLVAAYALSPIDLIPDFVPVLGMLDDLILVPLGVWAVLRMTPKPLLAALRAEAEQLAEKPSTSWVGAVLVVLFWAAIVLGLAAFFHPLLSPRQPVAAASA